jgi:hypothetical protein
LFIENYVGVSCSYICCFTPNSAFDFPQYTNMNVHAFRSRWIMKCFGYVLEKFQYSVFIYNSGYFIPGYFNTVILACLTDGENHELHVKCVLRKPTEIWVISTNLYHFVMSEETLFMGNNLSSRDGTECTVMEGCVLITRVGTRVWLSVAIYSFSLKDRFLNRSHIDICSQRFLLFLCIFSVFRPLISLLLDSSLFLMLRNVYEHLPFNIFRHFNCREACIVSGIFKLFQQRSKQTRESIRRVKICPI